LIPESRLQRVRDAFARNFSERGELGASVSIWQGGREILFLADGFREKPRVGEPRPWGDDTLVPVWSATKGPAAACVLRALAEARRSPDEPVRAVWPEFATAGKAALTFRQVLSHQAGLAALDDPADILDYPAVIAALESQAPHRPPGGGHGYHPRTFGFLLDEIVRRLSGARSLGEFWRETFARPHNLDFWIGLPEHETGRVATLYPGKLFPSPAETAFYQAFEDPGSLTRRAFGSPRGLHAVTAMNDPRARAGGFPGMGGIGTARALATFYALLAPPLSGIADADGPDHVFHLPTAFEAGFMKDPLDPETGEKIRRHFGPSTLAFGHPGAGGSLAFCDPENDLAFAYVMNQMAYGVLPNPRSLNLVAALYGEPDSGDTAPDSGRPAR